MSPFTSSALVFSVGSSDSLTSFPAGSTAGASGMIVNAVSSLVEMSMEASVVSISGAATFSTFSVTFAVRLTLVRASGNTSGSTPGS